MNKLTLTIVCGALALGACVSLLGRPVSARPQYSKAFLKKYVGDEETASQMKLAAAIKKVKKCNVCHDPNKKTDKGKSSKKFRNPYGEALAKLLPKKCKDKKIINDALDKVAAKKPEGKDVTYGGRLKKGELPHFGK